MVLKVDLKKAYDHLSWKFIHDTLLETKISTELIRVIMECITSGSINILWEGELTEDFKPTRGIRQGDTISPYIFVLCIRRLSLGIKNTVRAGKWKPVRLTRNEAPFMHLFFADDLLLLVEASCEQARIMNSVLETFCGSSGARVSK